jgi:DNA repair exonuclease SbcCD ATPase subunit
VNAEQRALQNEIDRISHKQPASGSRTAEELAKISELEDQIRNLNQSVHNLADEVESLSLNAADSEVFIDSLESNLRELQAANTAQGAIGTVKWRYCPLCLAELNPLSDDTCPLCKAQHHGDTYIAGRMRHEQELSHQINESRKLLEDRNSILSEKNRELALGIQRRSHAIEELRTLVSPSTNVDANVSQMLKKYGYLTRTVEYLTSLASLQSDVKDLEDQVASATAHLAALDSELQRRLHSQQERRLHCEDKLGA